MAKNEFLEKIEDKEEFNKEAYEHAKKDYELHLEAFKDLEEERKLQEDLGNLINENPTPIKFDFRYQEDPKYWEIQKKLRAINIKKQLRDFDIMLEQAKKTLKIKKETVESLKGE